jgi:hypothetical protein
MLTVRSVPSILIILHYIGTDIRDPSKLSRSP